jgi:L-alanine-DL-glutamate epimerase-like enolase superfamily enzyme
MKITKIRAYPVNVPMRIPYTTALVDRTVSNSVLAIVETDEGVTGLGQATTSAPLYAAFEQYQEAIVAAIEQKLAPAVLGADPFDLETLHDKMQRVARGHLYAHATIDLACHDLMGQATGRPVHKLIGGAVRDRIALVAPHLGLMPPARLAEQAAGFVREGYRFVNLRVGADLRQDIANLRAVREAIGDAIPIAVDFSQSLHFAGFRGDTAIGHLRKLEPFGVSAFEQPLADWDLEGMARVAAAIDTPIIADESVRTPEDVLRVIECRAADIIKIKIMKVGGIFPARKIAAICQAAAVPITVGNGIAGHAVNAAEAHFAFTIPNLKLPGEMNGFLRLLDDVATGDLMVRDGDLLRPDAPGLGVRLDPARLKAYRAEPAQR